MRKPTQKAHQAATPMTTAEATVAALIAHGIDTIYALPGVHNDHLFDALFKAGDAMRTIHTRHEQGAAYMALGAALATGKPQAYTVVPGPGLLNSSAALLTAYGMNAPVLALIGQIAQSAIGRGFGHLHEIRDQAGIIARLVDFSARIREPAKPPPLVAEAMQRDGAPAGRGPAVLECAIDVWGRSAPGGADRGALPGAAAPIDEDAIRDAAKRLGAAERPLIVCRRRRARRLRRGHRAVAACCRRRCWPIAAAAACSTAAIRSASPCRSAASCGARPMSCSRSARGCSIQFNQWGIDDELAIIRVDADPEEPERFRKPAVALIGDAAPILRRLIDALPAHNAKRPSRQAEMEERQAQWRKRLDKLAPQIGYLDAIRAELPEDGIFVDEVTQIGFAARLLFRSTSRARFSRPAIRTISAGALPPRSARQHARPRRAGGGDLRRRRLPVHRQRARHRHASPHSADDGGVQRRRLRQRAAHPGGAITATA